MAIPLPRQRQDREYDDLMEAGAVTLRLSAVATESDSIELSRTGRARSLPNILRLVTEARALTSLCIYRFCACPL